MGAKQPWLEWAESGMAALEQAGVGSGRSHRLTPSAGIDPKLTSHRWSGPVKLSPFPYQFVCPAGIEPAISHDNDRNGFVLDTSLLLTLTRWPGTGKCISVN
jgi:hypothetical protein